MGLNEENLTPTKNHLPQSLTVYLKRTHLFGKTLRNLVKKNLALYFWQQLTFQQTHRPMTMSFQDFLLFHLQVVFYVITEYIY
jgi:hypothetical protein